MTARDALLVSTPAGISSCSVRMDFSDVDVDAEHLPCPQKPVAVILGRTYCAWHGSYRFARYVDSAFKEALAHRVGPADPTVEGVPV